MNEPKSDETFAELLTAELEMLRSTAQRIDVPAGGVIFRQGDPGDGLYVVEEGSVEIAAPMGGGQQRVLSQFGDGAFFGEMSVLDQQPRSATATALTDTELRFIPAEEMSRVVEKSPRLLLALMREFTRRMRQMDRRLVEEVIQSERLGLVGRFAQSIVHDFKNPLNMIGFAADAAASEDAPQELRIEAKTIIRKQVDRMATMIGELLEFTRGTAATVRLEPLNYHAFIHDVMREISSESHGRNVEVYCVNEPPDITVAADSARLMRVFFNLIHNAIEMMPQGGSVMVRFTTTDSTVITEIEDTGPGIASEIAARLFEAFATHGKAHGTGLGLSICKRIVEDHGGQISAHSEPGRGAIFTFTLPL